MIHLKAVNVARNTAAAAFPFSVPTIKSLSEMTFSSEVTFLVGENGSGKSTFLEAVACAAGSITVGSEAVEADRTLAQIRTLAKTFKLTWSKKTRTGFFLRAEDFFGFTKRLAAIKEGLQKDLAETEIDYEGRSATARSLAQMPYLRELAALKQSYGEDLDGYSHGESYFTLFKSRFVPNGLYLLDEPEAALSPMRQMIFLSMLKMMVGKDTQFIIATHSPIILAYPGAAIFSFDGGKIQPVKYDELDHVTITREFLNNPAQYIQRLFDDLE